MPWPLVLPWYKYMCEICIYKTKWMETVQFHLQLHMHGDICFVSIPQWSRPWGKMALCKIIQSINILQMSFYIQCFLTSSSSFHFEAPSFRVEYQPKRKIQYWSDCLNPTGSLLQEALIYLCYKGKGASAWVAQLYIREGGRRRNIMQIL